MKALEEGSLYLLDPQDGPTKWRKYEEVERAFSGRDVEELDVPEDLLEQLDTRTPRLDTGHGEGSLCTS